MKTRLMFLTAVLLIVGFASASAQCGKMMGSGGHNHDNVTTSDEHSKHTATTESKAYAFINDDGMQEATITIKDGYMPNTIVAKKGVPMRLNFDLQEDKCTGTVVFKDFDIEQELTPYEVTAVEFTPAASGTFTFACPMEMITGTLIVKE
jgi:plastocyanin domain-containing protein